MDMLLGFLRQQETNSSLIWLLNHLIYLVPKSKLAVSLTVEGEGAAQDLLSAYARGVRHFPGSSLVKAEFSLVQLPHIVLTGAKLSGINLWATNLTGADLRYTELSGADLSIANLTGSNLTGANLSDASLIGTNLTGATGARYLFTQ